MINSIAKNNIQGDYVNLIKEQLSKAVNIIIELRLLIDGLRYINTISEVIPISSGEDAVKLKTLVKFDREGMRYISCD